MQGFTAQMDLAQWLVQSAEPNLVLACPSSTGAIAMGQSAEVPEGQIVDVAVQFLETAELLLRTRNVGGPSALLVNSAFATELYIKSLNAHWVYHLDEDVLED